ncbi:hypothetical protein QR680_016968 [Steinernema hermaphroditum]|uniref:3-beta hydroxysteroid dehydrogenase/isomerase domain-containing protein n=1 Tax=Steinernema hermaphroditum TaxID=289476 RepID=A0AA39LNA7_9BILA|nr:hypothetical protein QR680_016968 [Steinernema hermaphroditum]
MPERVAVIGAQSLLGTHLIRALEEDTNWEMSLWTPQSKLDAENNNDRCKFFCGDSELSAAVKSCGIAVCLHELQDLSAAPNVDDLKRTNVDFVERLTKCCQEAHVQRFILISSYFVQCSRRWPNIYSRELDAGKFANDAPFPEYVRSKVLAEEIVSKPTSMQTLVARTGPLYGEGDTKSIVCDMIKTLDSNNTVTFYSDKDGVIQMTYAGNAAYGILKALKKMLEETKTVPNETLLILDNTPIRNCSDFKSSIFLQYKPKFSYEEAKRRSSEYYKNLSSEKITCYSWEGFVESC